MKYNIWIFTPVDFFTFLHHAAPLTFDHPPPPSFSLISLLSYLVSRLAVSRLVSSRLVSSHLISSRLVSSYLVSSRLV